MRQIKYYFRVYKDLIVAVILCFVGFGGLFFGVVPAIQNTVSALDEVKTLSQTVEELSQKAKALDALSEDTLKNQLAIFTTAIPTEKSVPTIFATIDRVAEGAGVAIVDMSVTQAGSLATASAVRLSTEEKTLGASLLPFSLTIRGPLERVQAFIARIGSVRRLARVRSFDLSASTAGVVQARLSLDAFYVPLPTTLARADATLKVLSKQEEEALLKLSSFPWFSQPPAATPQGPVFGRKSNPFAR